MYQKTIVLLLLVYVNFIYANNLWKVSEYGINRGVIENSDLIQPACENIKGISGKKISLNANIAAFPRGVYKKHCGKYITVINIKKNISKKLIIADECQTCNNNQMMVPAYTWNTLYGENVYIEGDSSKENNSPGYIDVKWEFD